MRVVELDLDVGGRQLGGATVRLRDVADIGPQQSSNLITRENARRKAVVSAATASGALAVRPRVASGASSSMSPTPMPQRTISGVPSRSPLTSPATGATGRPMPQDSRLARRSRLAAACPPPKRAASTASWCEPVKPRPAPNTGSPAVARCPACRAWRAALRASQDLPAGAEVTVATSSDVVATSTHGAAGTGCD